PLMNLKVRQAISYSINKNEMVKYLRNNTVIAANNGFVPPSLIKHESAPVYYEFNPALANKLLDEAGYSNRKKLSPVTISTTSDYADLMEYIQHELEKVGVRAKVNVLQGPALREQS